MLVRQKKKAWLALLGLGIVAVTAITWHGMAGSDDIPSDVVGAVVKSRASRVDPSDQRGLLKVRKRFDIFSIRRAGATKLYVSSLFGSRTWYEPHPPKPVVHAVQAISAPAAPLGPPPLPFTYIGKVVDGNKVTVFLSADGTQYTVRNNDTIEGKYHVDKITEGELVLTYNPLNIQQTLQIGGESNDNSGSAMPTPGAGPVSLTKHNPSNPSTLIPQAK